MNPQDQVNQSLPEPVQETPAQRWERQFREASVAIDVTRMAMAQSLDAALHGTVTARPESPKIVWEALLDEVERLAQGARIADREALNRNWYAPIPATRTSRTTQYWPPPEPKRRWWQGSFMMGAFARDGCPVCYWQVGHPSDCPNR